MTTRQDGRCGGIVGKVSRGPDTGTSARCELVVVSRPTTLNAGEMRTHHSRYALGVRWLRLTRARGGALVEGHIQ